MQLHSEAISNHGTATGRQTGNNELTEIGKELAKFIAQINNIEK